LVREPNGRGFRNSRLAQLAPRSDEIVPAVLGSGIGERSRTRSGRVASETPSNQRESRLTLATVAAKDRNEDDAAVEVIGLIDLKGKIVTADALRCNRRTVEAIIEKGGDSRMG
jgi:hypothetical protein